MHGSAYAAVGQALVDRLAVRLPDWNVRYGMPWVPGDFTNTAGEHRAVWVKPDGRSDLSVVATGPVYEEDGTIGVVFQHLTLRSGSAQEVIDEDVALAMGELLTTVTVEPNFDLPAGTGWGPATVTVSGTERKGGVTEDGKELGRNQELSFRFVTWSVA